MGWGRRPVSPVGYIVTELIFGGIFSLIVFLVSLAIGEFGVWVLLQWMLPPEQILKYFYLIVGVVVLLFAYVPIYNRRFVQLIGLFVFLAILWLILVKKFSFDPIYTFFS